ncbi:hypothetical protein FRC02_010274 [Tulasnella sp. 418]|nr:hypothetical protein FRC02_010274 [Tulasnella sp. 418]
MQHGTARHHSGPHTPLLPSMTTTIAESTRTRARINFLPQEVLSLILLRCWEEQDCSPQLLKTLGLVCTLWFDTVRTTPGLGSALYDIAPLERNKRIISSSEGGLDIVVCKTSWDQNFLRLIDPLIHRWRSFLVRKPLARWPDQDDLDLERPAPLLKVFRARHRGQSQHSALNLFAGEGPLLRHLEMLGSTIHFSPDSFRHLRVLSVMVGHGCNTIMANDALAALSSSRHLEDLSMYGPSCRGCISNISNSSSYPEITFPNLRNISLHHLCVSTLLQAISSTSAPFLRNIFLDVSMMTIHELNSVMEHHPRNGILAEVSDNVTKASITGDKKSFNVETCGTIRFGRVYDGVKWWREEVIDTLDDVSHPFHISFPIISQTLVHLNITTCSILNGYKWESPLCYMDWGCLVALETLIISADRMYCSTMEAILGAPLPYIHSTKERPCQNWPCPGLRNLEFHYCSIEVEILRSCVERRYGLGELCFCDGMVFPPYLDRIEIRDSDVITSRRDDGDEALAGIQKAVGPGVLFFSPREYRD